ncbi:MAG: hypothetical protein MK098_07045 [Marinovum sp.]|nr:hypothetical protein [Marinovum sp.]
MRIGVAIICAFSAVLLVLLTLDVSSIGAWAIEAQRGFQNQIAGAVRALKSGDPGAYIALLSATAAYGFVHALGPGHGKYLVGGVGLGTSVSARKLVGLALASSVAQSIWAIVLVYGGFAILATSARSMTTLAEEILAPASYLAIAAVGVYLIWRGARTLQRVAVVGPRPGGGYRLASQHSFAHASGFSESAVQWSHAPLGDDTPHDESCNCAAHGLTAAEVERVTSLRDGIALVLSVAVRPCTGAIFLLVIAWQMDLAIAGALAVLVMGLGTAALTSLVAISTVVARGVALAMVQSTPGLRMALPAMQMFAGALIVLISLSLLRF